jgi:hypothetical protein
MRFLGSRSLLYQEESVLHFRVTQHCLSTLEFAASAVVCFSKSSQERTKEGRKFYDGRKNRYFDVHITQSRILTKPVLAPFPNCGFKKSYNKHPSYSLQTEEPAATCPALLLLLLLVVRLLFLLLLLLQHQRPLAHDAHDSFWRQGMQPCPGESERDTCMRP